MVIFNARGEELYSQIKKYIRKNGIRSPEHIACEFNVKPLVIENSLSFHRYPLGYVSRVFEDNKTKKEKITKGINEAVLRGVNYWGKLEKQLVFLKEI